MYDEMVYEIDDAELFETFRSIMNGKFSYLLKDYRILWALDIALERGGMDSEIKRGKEKARHSGIFRYS